MKTALTSFALAAVTLMAARAFAEPAVKPAAAANIAVGIDAASLAGHYKIVSSEKEGVETPQEKIDGVIVVFTADKIVASDKDKNEVYAASYEIDAKQHPAAITMVSTGKESQGVSAKGLIQKKDDYVKLIYTLPKGTGTPTDFKTKQGQIMVILQKMKTPPASE
ncbi:MAG: TIGR03067 domain-containing protein [Pirellulaceae bacterium]